MFVVVESVASACNNFNLNDLIFIIIINYSAFFIT